MMAYRRQTSGKFVGSAVAAGLALAILSGHHKGGSLLSRVAGANASEHGTLGCSGLEALWEAAGGSPSAASTAASVAMAESSGQQDASSPAGDVGYWQINEPIWGSSMATTDPMGNARAAVQISHDGTDWSPWVTYNSGAYQGKC